MSTASQGGSEKKIEWVQRLSGLLGTLIFALAVLFIHHIASQYSWQQVWDSLTVLPVNSVLLAVLATVLSYAMLVCYDLLGMAYIGRRVGGFRTTSTSFIAFAMTNNIGMANLAGNSVRLRMYSFFGLTPIQILALIVFISFSFWTGFLGLSGLLFLVAPPTVPNAILQPVWVRLIGMVLVCVPLSYFVLCYKQWAPNWFKRFKFDLPTWRMAILQIVISAVEWALAGVALYALLPEHYGLLEFLSVFGMAQFLALLSHVPGGLGVLEATVIYFISPDKPPTAAALGALLAFRIIYYFAPFVLALLGLTTFEVYKRAHQPKFK